MKKSEKRFILLCCLVLAAGMAGCSLTGWEANPYRVDTVVRIPVDPTKAPTETETAVQTEQSAEETVPPTEAEPVVTEPTEEKPDSSGKSSGGSSKSSGGSGSKGSTKKNTDSSSQPTEPPKPTDPPVTQPPASEPAITEPPMTEPPMTEPAQTAPPVTEPPAAQPPATEATETLPAEITEPADRLYDISGYVVGSLEYAMQDQINAARSDAGVSTLSLDARLSAIASARSYELSQLWSHTRPDGRSYATVLDDYGYSAGTVTELLVYVSGSEDAAAMVGKWMDSDTHKESLLRESCTAVGIGVYRADGFSYVCCLMVG